MAIMVWELILVTGPAIALLKSTMVAMTLSPSRLISSATVFLWGSVNVNYGFLSLTRNVDDTDVKEKDHDWVMSYRLGLLMALTDQTRAGITEQ